MGDTRENILLTALHLFARDGYEAVSVSDIAGALNMTKGALYKHYKNKRDIFDSIVSRMEALDAERAQEFELPEGTVEEMSEAYKNATPGQLTAFGKAQFEYWTQEDFPASFRRMLTLEQYRSEEIGKLYQQYLVSGPLGYITDLLRSCGMANAENRAIELYAPMFLFYSLSDGGWENAAEALNAHLDTLAKDWQSEE